MYPTALKLLESLESFGTLESMAFFFSPVTDCGKVGLRFL